MSRIYGEYVKKVTRRNKRRPDRVYYYSCPPGLDPVPIPYSWGTSQFDAFVQRRNLEATRKNTPPETGSFHHLAETYRGNTDRGIPPSRPWSDLAPRTQKDYNQYVDDILSRWGQFPVADLEVEMIVERRDAMRDRPRTANYWLNVLSSMLNLAVERPKTFGLRDNPARRVRRFGKKAGVKPRQVYWTYADEQRFLADADRTDPVVALGHRLLAYTGQRPGDVRVMQLSDYDGVRLNVVQQKTGAKVWIRCHKDLKVHLDCCVREAREKCIINATFIRGLRGRPLGERYFATRWDAIAARTGTAHLNRQDLRRTAVIRLAEASRTVPEITSITGHTPASADSILQTYLVTTYDMADAAITKLEQSQDRRRERMKHES